MGHFRAAIGALIGIAVLACAVGCASSPSATTVDSLTHTIPAGELGGALTSASTGAAEQVLASDGIATVADESSSAPLVRVTGAVRSTFTKAQVRAMTLEAANRGGVSGATLDAAVAVPAGDPQFAFVLASWIRNAKTPGATAVRRLMGTQTWTDAPTLVFPTIALPLFTADVLGRLPTAPTASPTVHIDVNRSAVASVVEASFVHTSGLGTVCSTASNFVQGVLNSVFMALQFDTSASSGVGGFFKTVWNGAISLAQGAIQGIVTTITAPVLNVIKTIAGAASVIAQIASYLNPWSVKVTADPASVTAGSGGTFSAKVDTGTGGTDYPSAITDCAGSLGITLPPLTAAGAKATWELGGPLSTDADTSVTLDDQSASKLDFTSTKPAGTACSSTASDEVGTGRITVTRPGVDGLKQLASGILTTGLGVAGGIIGPVVDAVLSPIIDSVLGKVDALTKVSGSTSVLITGATSGTNCNASSSTPEPTHSAESAACIVGTWRTTNQTLTPPGGLSGAAGATWTITAQGKVTEDYTGSTPLYEGTNYAGSYTGTAVLMITIPSASATTGPWMMKSESGQIYLNGHAGTADFSDPTASPAGTWTCSDNSMTLTTTVASSTLGVTLQRAG